MARSLRRRAARLVPFDSVRGLAAPSRLIIAVAVVLALAPPGASAQANDDDAGPPRTSWGVPDLQGVWLSHSATPLERPAALAGRARLTDEEVATLRERAARIFRNNRSSFAAADNAFLAAFDNVDTFYSPNAPSGSDGMVEREFDNRTSLVVDPPDGRIPALTAEAERRQAAVPTRFQRKAGPEDFNNMLRCITTSVPRLGGNFGAGPYSYYQIVQTPGYFVVLMEAFHEARVIPLDGRPHLPNGIRQLNGDSRGHWDGDTLVVETRNFSSGSYFRGAEEALQLVERFTRTADDTITYGVTLTDPTTWVTSWTAEMPLKQREEAIYEFACHEGNDPLMDMLSIARFEENAAKDVTSPGGR